MRTGAALLALTVALLAAPPVRAEVAVPPLTARVTDLAAALTPGQRSALERRLAEFEQRKGAQIAVLLVPTTAPEAIEQYAIRVAEAWKLGRKGVDDGALLLVAKDDRALRIEVGYGLEGVVPDAIAKRVIDEVIVPFFKRGDFYGGIEAGAAQLIRLVDGEPLPPPAARDPGWNSIFDMLPLLFIAVFVGGGILRALLGRLVGASVAGGIVGVAAWIMLGLGIAVAVGLVAFVLVLIMGFNVGGGRRGHGGWGSGIGGGGWSGGGGFSGGGGGFGGGGASGRW